MTINITTRTRFLTYIATILTGALSVLLSIESLEFGFLIAICGAGLMFYGFIRVVNISNHSFMNVESK